MSLVKFGACSLSFLLRQIVLLIAVSTLYACSEPDEISPASLLIPDATDSKSRDQIKPETLLDKIRQRGKLVVLTTNSPTTYYYDRDNQITGPEYDMTQAFARSLDVKVEYRIYDSTKSVIDALRKNKGDIAAAGLTLNDVRKKQFDFGPVYQDVTEYLVCHRSRKPIKSKDELKGVEIIATADSSYIDTLKEIPQATWAEDKELHTAQLLEQVADKKIECTVSDSTLYSIEKRYYMEIQNKLTISKKSQIAWMLNKHNDALLKAINTWFSTYKDKSELAHTMDKYYGYVELFDYVDTHKFLKRVRTRLPKYKDFFIDAAKQNGIEPTILAAQSYQESHWNRKAKSPTGVRGIMMLTQPVAKSLGVTNRLHAEQNIYAGAKFHAKMKKMVEHVEEPDRTWLALAAYNVGRGHFRDAQSLARKLNKNPDRWAEMKEVLPLLSQKKYYKDLRYGYARGNEPVQYVTRIRSYNELLHQHFDVEKAVASK